MQKRSNNIYIYIISTSLSMATANAEENNITGLQIGFGLNASRDNYESDVNVGIENPYREIKDVTFVTSDEAIVPTEKFTKENATKFINDIANTNSIESEYIDNFQCAEENINFGDTIVIKGGSNIKITDHDIDGTNNCYVEKTNDADDKTIEERIYTPLCNVTIYEDQDNTTPIEITTDDNIYLDTTNYVDSETPIASPIFVQLTETGSFFSRNTYNLPPFLLKNQNLKGSVNSINAELKLSYFHDLGNNIIAGLDFSGNILSNNTKLIKVNPFDVNRPQMCLRQDDHNGGDVALLYAEYSNTTNRYEITQIFENAQITANTDSYFVGHTLDDIIATNEGINFGTTAQLLVNQNVLVSNKTPANIEFNKGAFAPKLAFVAGKSFGDWFIGARAGMEYVTGNVKLSTNNLYSEQYTTSSKNVSIASPFVGLHVIKQTKLCGGANMYVTADWNIGDGHKKVDMNGVKSFKHSGYNVSAGVTWKCKIGL